MKTTATLIPAGLLIVLCASAQTSIPIIPGEPDCLYNAFVVPNPITASGTFTLTNCTGTATLNSSVPVEVPTFVPYIPYIYLYNYQINLGNLTSPTTHCVKLVIHFGPSDGCGSEEVWADPSQIQSASLAIWGDITLLFNGGCLEPGQPEVPLTLLTGTTPRIGTVTVIDDYLNTQTGQMNEEQITVPAVVPDIPPDPPAWYFLQLTGGKEYLPPPWLQGSLVTNQAPLPPPLGGLTGTYNFALQILDLPTNGLAVSQIVTQTVQVASGLFTMPLPFDPDTFFAPAWLSISVAPTNSNNFTPLNSPLPISPTPQAFYAYTAGSVADLTPGQAVTSLNGLTDTVLLQAGNGIVLGTNGNTLTISAVAGASSDRNIKADIKQANEEAILAGLTALPIESWRYTNEAAGIRHVGPMAQDFHAEFGLGADEKIIGYVDAQGVALAAIQELNRKLNEREAVIERQAAEIAELRARMDKLEQTVNANQSGKNKH